MHWQTYTALFLGIFMVKAHCLCDYPCSWQNREFFATYNETLIQGLRYPSPSIAEISYNGQVAARNECFQRQGPFIMTRKNGNRYGCFKVVYEGQDVLSFRGRTWENFDSPPDFCSFCSIIDDFSENDLNLEVWVANSVKSGLGCNVPKDCPVTSYDTACSGCEEYQPDSGYCCDGDALSGDPLPVRWFK